MATKKPEKMKTSNVTAAVQGEVPPTFPVVVEKLDRIIELLEGTLQVKNKGFDFKSNPLWEKMIDR